MEGGEGLGFRLVKMSLVQVLPLWQKKETMHESRSLGQGKVKGKI